MEMNVLLFSIEGVERGDEKKKLKCHIPLQMHSCKEKKWARQAEDSI